jgi:hypothetical protein
VLAQVSEAPEVEVAAPGDGSLPPGEPEPSLDGSAASAEATDETADVNVIEVSEEETEEAPAS